MFDSQNRRRICSIGGLHRDGYGVVIRGDRTSIYAFAAWYRGVIAAEHKLYLYDWADEGIEITVGGTAKTLEEAIETLNNARQQPLATQKAEV
jgi:hypothetical protein